MTVHETFWKETIASLGCVICWQQSGNYVPCEVHHVAENSGKRSDFSIVPLCKEHHTGAAGFHTLGTKRFCSLYRIPGETEYGLLILTNEMLARKLRER